MKLQTHLLLLASVAAALIITSSRGGVVAAGGTHEMMPLLRGSVEDDAGLGELEEELAYPHRRVLYNPNDVGYSGLQASKPACGGSCAGKGQAYTGRGCQAKYGCRGR